MVLVSRVLGPPGACRAGGDGSTSSFAWAGQGGVGRAAGAPGCDREQDQGRASPGVQSIPRGAEPRSAGLAARAGAQEAVNIT